MSVDWSRPIEVVGLSGIYPAWRLRDGNTWPDPGGQYHVESRKSDAPLFYNEDGREYQGRPWMVRNTASDASNPHGEARSEAKGVSGYNDDPQGLQARCEALVRRIAAGDWAPGYSVDTETEARAIVRKLDIRQLIDDLMAQDMPERDRLAAAYEAGRKA